MCPSRSEMAHSEHIHRQESFIDYRLFFTYISLTISDESDPGCCLVGIQYSIKPSQILNETQMDLSDPSILIGFP